MPAATLPPRTRRRVFAIRMCFFAMELEQTLDALEPLNVLLAVFDRL